MLYQFLKKIIILLHNFAICAFFLNKSIKYFPLIIVSYLSIVATETRNHFGLMKYIFLHSEHLIRNCGGCVHVARFCKVLFGS